jgi:hypothetical protein
MYNYISEIDFSIPKSTLKKVKDLGPVSTDYKNKDSRNPIYKQINYLLFQNKKNIETITLFDKDQNETVTVSNYDLNIMGQRLDTWDPDWRSRVSVFREKELDLIIGKEIISFLPKQLQDLNPVVSLQTKREGTYITPPHKDHHRTCTFWYLLNGNDEQTIWWEEIDYFEDYRFWRFADPKKIKEVKRAVLKKKIWYLFDNSSYHSVESLNEPTNDRTTLCIEFNSISAKDLYNLFQQTK